MVTSLFQRIDVPNELTFFTEILNLLTVQNELRWELETRIRNNLKSEKIHSIRIAKFKSSVKVMAILDTTIDQMVSFIFITDVAFQFDAFQSAPAPYRKNQFRKPAHIIWL